MDDCDTRRIAAGYPGRLAPPPLPATRRHDLAGSNLRPDLHKCCRARRSTRERIDPTVCLWRYPVESSDETPELPSHPASALRPATGRPISTSKNPQTPAAPATDLPAAPAFGAAFPQRATAPRPTWAKSPINPDRPGARILRPNNRRMGSSATCEASQRSDDLYNCERSVQST